MIYIAKDLDKPRQLRMMAKLAELGIACKLADLEDDIKLDTNPENAMTDDELAFLWETLKLVKEA